MNNNDRAEFARIMYGLAENFSAPITDGGIDIRFDALRHYSIEKIKDAAIKIIKTRKYTTMPTVADFMEHLEMRHEDVAEVEAMKVLDFARTFGASFSPQFDDPVTQYLVRSRFSFRGICESKESENSFFVRDFKAAYKAVQSAQDAGTLMIDNHKNLKLLTKGIGL
ncbi:MAG: hypothetical protein SVM79_00190 [Chloroflexota bacterium]|nr:hypothetical protein [Chloroflexota bacterium]